MRVKTHADRHGDQCTHCESIRAARNSSAGAQVLGKLLLRIMGSHFTMCENKVLVVYVRTVHLTALRISHAMESRMFGRQLLLNCKDSEGSHCCLIIGTVPSG